MARSNASSFAFDGLLKPDSFLTNCSDAARTSSSVAGWLEIEKRFDVSAHAQVNWMHAQRHFLAGRGCILCAMALHFVWR